MMVDRMRGPYKSYDHRLRDLSVTDPGAIGKPGIEIPRSTLATWASRSPRKVVSVDALSADEVSTRKRLLALEHQVALLRALVRLLFAMFRLCSVSLPDRLPAGKSKGRVLRAVEEASRVIARKRVLKLLGLSEGRYRSWCSREEACRLEDASTCPRRSPTRATANELSTMRELVTSAEHKHFSLTALAIHAARIGRVALSPSTWLRIARERKWRRPRQRLYPAKPKEGIRAQCPNEYWHLDVTILKLLDGTRAYVHAVIDNASRRILAYRVSGTFDVGNSRRVLLSALSEMQRSLAKGSSKVPTVVTDLGVENVGPVGAMADEGLLLHLLAQVDVTFSNSMIERWFLSLRHAWLYQFDLRDIGVVERLVERFVHEYNSVMPHSALCGRTPDEVYFGKNADLAEGLKAKRSEARAARIETNRKRSCDGCPHLRAVPVKAEDPSHIAHVEIANEI